MKAIQDELTSDMLMICQKVSIFKDKLQMYSHSKKKLAMPLSKYEECVKADRYQLSDLLRLEQLYKEKIKKQRMAKLCELDN